MSTELKDRQELFCLEYMKDYHGTNAAIRAGYSAQTSYSIASELLKKPEIKARINELKAKISGRNGVTIDRIVGHLSKIAFADRTLIYEADGKTLKPANEWPEEIRAAITGIEVDEIMVAGSPLGHTKKVKLLSQDKALDMLMKYTGGFEKDNKQKATKLRIGFGKPKTNVNEEPETEIETDTDDEPYDDD